MCWQLGRSKALLLSLVATAEASGLVGVTVDSRSNLAEAKQHHAAAAPGAKLFRAPDESLLPGHAASSVLEEVSNSDDAEDAATAAQERRLEDVRQLLNRKGRQDPQEDGSQPLGPCCNSPGWTDSKQFTCADYGRDTFRCFANDNGAIAACCICKMGRKQSSTCT
eukprot:TRINITY_DN9336_c0_g1_i4.p2 TRINITY_DN9336_c0_g1~~TRINITY_DN9336_c0_g1_i4.p2  ORF type:complete len:166 (-),score=43.15 TRINITY_DN9336_c0_g1_i4:385-882(-)